MFIDTGARLAEVAGLLVSSLELDHGLLTVTGKGSRQRVLPLGARTIKALDRYLRERARHHAAAQARLWLGRKGPMTVSGITQMIQRRSRQAGVEDLHPHRFRRTFAHQWLAAQGTEGGLVQVTEMAVEGDARPVWRLGGRRAGPRRAPQLSGRSPDTFPAPWALSLPMPSKRGPA